MAQTRLTAVMKTDIRGFTSKVGMLSNADLGQLLESHKALISEAVARNAGRIIKGEGDAFWIVFDSVTRAAVAAMDIQDELRIQQSGHGDESRLAVRIVITAGDVLFRDNDIFGEVVNLAARIEAITPADEVYLSRAADLALNKAEVKTQPVGEYSFKGFDSPETVLKIDRKHQTRVFEDVAIVFTDVSGYTAFTLNNPLDEAERFMSMLEIVHNRACQAHGGTVRLIMGDCYFMSFPEPEMALEAVTMLIKEWEDFTASDARYSENRLTIGVHTGDMYHFRSSLFGQDINTAARLQGLAERSRPGGGCAALFSEKVVSGLDSSEWRERFEEVDAASLQAAPELGRIYRLR